MTILRFKCDVILLHVLYYAALIKDLLLISNKNFVFAFILFHEFPCLQLDRHHDAEPIIFFQAINDQNNWRIVTLSRSSANQHDIIICVSHP